MLQPIICHQCYLETNYSRCELDDLLLYFHPSTRWFITSCSHPLYEIFWFLELLLAFTVTQDRSDHSLHLFVMVALVCLNENKWSKEKWERNVGPLLSPPLVCFSLEPHSSASINCSCINGYTKQIQTSLISRELAYWLYRPMHGHSALPIFSKYFPEKDVVALSQSKPEQ